MADSPTAGANQTQFLGVVIVVSALFGVWLYVTGRLYTVGQAIIGNPYTPNMTKPGTVTGGVTAGGSAGYQPPKTISQVLKSIGINVNAYDPVTTAIPAPLGGNALATLPHNPANPTTSPYPWPAEYGAQGT